MRRLLWLLLAVPAPARADVRLDPGAIPDTSVFELVYPLDRYSATRFRICGNEAITDTYASIAAGLGTVDGDGAPVASGTVAASSRGPLLLLSARSELTASALEIIRGRHRALAEINTDDDSTGTQIGIEGHLEHGRAPGLAPIHLGPGERVDTGVTARAVIPFSKRRDKDGAWALAMRGNLGGTWWKAGSPVEGATRRSLGFGWGRTPLDGELPRGSIEFLRGRVEHASIRRPIAAASTGGAMLDTAVRTVEIGAGTDELTLHIDRELLGIVAVDLGWSWLEADTASGHIADNAFRARLSTALRWRTDHEHVRNVGIALARLPDYTPDGQQLVTDVRTELSAAQTSKQITFAARGGISWIHPTRGAGARQIRYGSQLELFVAVARNIEVGGYYATWFEQTNPGDPSRRWSTEAGVSVRLRSRTAEERAPRREPEGERSPPREPEERARREPDADDPTPRALDGDQRESEPPIID